MEHMNVPVTPPSSRKKSFRGQVLIALAGLSFMLIVLVIDVGPVVPERRAPTAEQVMLVRRQALALQGQLRTNAGRASIRMSNADLASASTLIGALEKFGRVDAVVEKNMLIVRYSRQLGLFWINGQARVSPSSKGFPAAELQIGDLPLGSYLSCATINLAAVLVRLRGIDLPPIDDVVRSIQIDGQSVLVDIHLPLNGAFANGISNFRSKPVDPELTAAAYCHLVTENRKAPSNDMAVHVRRAFRYSVPDKPVEEQNRAAFVALAMYTTAPAAGRLAGDASQRVARCEVPTNNVVLAGRTDLARHWALSAALAVSLGEEFGSAMGEWKELSDSRPGGSGFSFVDLAADRAGLAFARQASDPATANATVRKLRTANGTDLLPVRALALSEGLTERQFVEQFKAVDSAQFEAAKARIDAVLSRHGVLLL